MKDPTMFVTREDLKDRTLIKAENENYVLKFTYIGTDYDERKANKNFQPDTVNNLIRPKHFGCPKLNLILSDPSVGNKETVYLSLDSIYAMLEKEIDKLIDQLEYAKATMPEIHRILSEYFPNLAN